MELTAEFGAIISLDDMRPKRQSRKSVIDKLNGRFLIDLFKDFQHPQTRTVIDRGVLIISVTGSFDSF